ncbi:MAG: type II toxin-antitoxin system VapB family antitoxin [bacterium]
MALQIANPVVVRKVEALAKATGLSRTAVVEKAVDRMLSEVGGTTDTRGRMASLLHQLDQVADRPDAFDPQAWDADGLPR